MGGAVGAGGNSVTVAGDDGRELPYPCRMYESVPGEEELLQLQWMRIDVRCTSDAHLLRLSDARRLNFEKFQRSLPPSPLYSGAQPRRLFPNPQKFIL